MKPVLLMLLAALASDCHPSRYFIATDLTPENSFSKNCEGPAVDKAGNLYVVNYQKDGTVGIFRPDGSAEVFVELPAGSIANAIRFDSRGELVLADFGAHNILKINPSTRKVSVFCHDERFHQPNDLCITKSDVVYTSDPDWKNSGGQLWMVSPDGKPTLLESGMSTTNGIELSPDEEMLYVNESVARKIWVYDLLPTGKLSNKRLFAQFDEHGLDGMKCDRAGNLYVTRYGSGLIAVFSPTGKLLRQIQLKGKDVSNLTFGGPDGRTVYATLQDRRCVETFRNEEPGKGF